MASTTPKLPKARKNGYLRIFNVQNQTITGYVVSPSIGKLHDHTARVLLLGCLVECLALGAEVAAFGN